ncbi:MAG: hypothetical protein ACXIUO_08985 [Erythrobacter sp.]
MTTRRDYTNRLVALSKGWLNVSDARALIQRDINSDFLALMGPGDDWELFKETDTIRLEKFFGSDGLANTQTTCETLRVDFLNPTSGYLDMMLASGLTFYVVDAEFHLRNAMNEMGIPPFCWTISCTTANDHPMSAYRRTIIILNRDADVNDVRIGGARHQLSNPEVFGQVEDRIDQILRSEIDMGRLGFQ